MERYLFNSPKGNQSKHVSGEYVIKNDYFGGEAVSELLVSLFLESSNLRRSAFVHYRLGNQSNISVSENYKPRYRFVSFDRLLLQLIIPEEHDKLLKSVSSTYCNLPVSSRVGHLRDAWVRSCWNRISIEDRPKYLIDRANKYLNVGKDDVYNYLCTLQGIDVVFFNYDRHFQNFGLMYDTYRRRYLPSKIFDNGMALGVGLNESDRKRLVTFTEGNLSFQPYATLYRNNRRALPLFPCWFRFDVGVFANLVESTGSKEFVIASSQYKIFRRRLVHFSEHFYDGNLERDLKLHGL